MARHKTIRRSPTGRCGSGSSQRIQQRTHLDDCAGEGIHKAHTRAPGHPPKRQSQERAHVRTGQRDAGRRGRANRRSSRPRGARRRRRRRRRSVRQQRRLLAGHRRPRRRAAREDHVPAREGLRRRPDPARHPRPGRHGHRRQRDSRLAAQQGPARDRRRPAAAPGLARAHQLPALRPGPPPRRPRRAARQPGRQGRRPAARADHASPSRSSTAPAGSSASSGRTGPDKEPVEFRAPIVLACDGVSRQARAAPRRAPQRQAPAGRRGPPLLHQPAHARRLPRVLAGAVGRPARTSRDAAARLRLDLRHGRRHGQRRPRRAQLQRRLPARPTTARCSPLARQHPGGVGPARGERHRPDPRRRAADGLQPHAALPPRPAARRRLRRLGQPVQRRGHPLRDGVGQVRRRGRRAGAGPPGRPERASGPCAATPSGWPPSGAPTTASAACS